MYCFPSLVRAPEGVTVRIGHEQCILPSPSPKAPMPPSAPALAVELQRVQHADPILCHRRSRRSCTRLVGLARTFGLVMGPQRAAMARIFRTRGCICPCWRSQLRRRWQCHLSRSSSRCEELTNTYSKVVSNTEGRVIARLEWPRNVQEGHGTNQSEQR